MFAKLFSAALLAVSIQADFDCSTCFEKVTEDKRAATCTIVQTSPGLEWPTGPRLAEFPTTGTVTFTQTRTSTRFTISETSNKQCNKTACPRTLSTTDLRIQADVQNISPGSHGFHVHSWGDVGANGDGTLKTAKSAGGHYNPRNRVHGAWDIENQNKRHVGCLQSLGGPPCLDEWCTILNCDPRDGFQPEGGCETTTATLDYEDPLASLFGSDQIQGRALIIHNGQDDLGLGEEDCSLANGCAGPRIAACTIVPVNPDSITWPAPPGW